MPSQGSADGDVSGDRKKRAPGHARSLIREHHAPVPPLVVDPFGEGPVRRKAKGAEGLAGRGLLSGLAGATGGEAARAGRGAAGGLGGDEVAGEAGEVQLHLRRESDRHARTAGGQRRE